MSDIAWSVENDSIKRGYMSSGAVVNGTSTVPIQNPHKRLKTFLSNSKIRVEHYILSRAQRIRIHLPFNGERQVTSRTDKASKRMSFYKKKLAQIFT